MSVFQLAEADTERFSEWMKNKVKSIHYADNLRMTEAYTRVFNNNIKLASINGRFNLKK